MQSIPKDEEARGLLRRIVERQAYRMLMLANIRGHGIKYFPEVRDKLAMAERLSLSLHQFREVERLYGELSDEGVVTVVRSRMERIPYPVSRLDLAVCLFLCERVERLSLEAYRESCAGDLAAIARTRLEVLEDVELPSDPAFVEYCADAGNRPHAQQLFNRWLAICLLSLGRPTSAGSARVLELGLRSRATAQIAIDFLSGLMPFLEACSLEIPDADALGIELPVGWDPAAAPARRREGPDR